MQQDAKEDKYWADSQFTFQKLVHFLYLMFSVFILFRTILLRRDLVASADTLTTGQQILLKELSQCIKLHTSQKLKNGNGIAIYHCSLFRCLLSSTKHWLKINVSFYLSLSLSSARRRSCKDAWRTGLRPVCGAIDGEKSIHRYSGYNRSRKYSTSPIPMKVVGGVAQYDGTKESGWMAHFRQPTDCLVTKTKWWITFHNDLQTMYRIGESDAGNN